MQDKFCDLLSKLINMDLTTNELEVMNKIITLKKQNKKIKQENEYNKKLQTIINGCSECKSRLMLENLKDNGGNDYQ